MVCVGLATPRESRPEAVLWAGGGGGEGGVRAQAGGDSEGGRAHLRRNINCPRHFSQSGKGHAHKLGL